MSRFYKQVNLGSSATVKKLFLIGHCNCRSSNLCDYYLWFDNVHYYNIM